MTEKKRYSSEQYKDWTKYSVRINDNETGIWFDYLDDFDKVVNRLNEQDIEIKKLRRIVGFLENDNTDDVLNVLNKQEERIKELEKENRGLEFKIIDMLDFIKEKETVTREEIKKWWNGDVE